MKQTAAEAIPRFFILYIFKYLNESQYLQKI